ALGSTGSYVYLDPEERARVAQLSVDSALDIPVFVGIGALRTRDVLANARTAEAAGAKGLLLAPVSYQPLTDDEVFALFRTVAEETSLPIAVYDNPSTTHFTFSTELYARLAELEAVASIKIPGAALPPAGRDERTGASRAAVGREGPSGICGGALGAEGRGAGCGARAPAVGGTLAEPILAITRAAELGNAERARELSAELQPLWDLFAEYGGSLRVTAAIAEHLGLVGDHSLPLPIHGLDEAARAEVAKVV